MAENDEFEGEVSDNDSEFEGEQSELELEGEQSGNEVDDDGRPDRSGEQTSPVLTKKAKPKKKKKK